MSFGLRLYTSESNFPLGSWLQISHFREQFPFGFLVSEFTPQSAASPCSRFCLGLLWRVWFGLLWWAGLLWMVVVLDAVQQVLCCGGFGLLGWVDLLWMTVLFLLVVAGFWMQQVLWWLGLVWMTVLF